MDQKTIDALVKLNLQFYEAIAQSFSDTRQHAWSGWQNLLAYLPHQTTFHVLDVACGNGRFGAFLYSRLKANLIYTGIDMSKSLLNDARKQAKSLDVDWDLREVDVLDAGFWEQEMANFDLVSVFGLMHHIPSFEQRLLLLRRALTRAVHGLLVVTFWDYRKDDRFWRKVVDPDENVKKDLIDLEIEQGDYFLTWQNNPNWLRYVHTFSDEEIDLYVEKLRCIVIADYRADGKQGGYNRYLVLSSKS